jgi:hypothetical protein
MITYIIDRLPVFQAGNTGTIQFSYHDSCQNGTNGLNHDLTKADSRAGAADGGLMYFVKIWELGWFCDQ